jgi:pyruvate/2-oxoacid:ferredoxin oxidoreductase beta subunit
LHPLSEVAHLAYITWCHRHVELEELDANHPISRVSGYHEMPEAEMVRAEVALWQNATQAIAALAPVYGFSYIHVIQPNQYQQGSKPLSSEEKEKFLAYDHYGTPIRQYYHDLNFDFWPEPPADVTQLDLRKVFQNHTETLYRDACCHLNNAGMALLSEAIAEQAKPVFVAKLAQ